MKRKVLVLVSAPLRLVHIINPKAIWIDKSFLDEGFVALIVLRFELTLALMMHEKGLHKRTNIGPKRAVGASSICDVRGKIRGLISDINMQTLVP